MIEKIVSGGQTGADRAALDWAISRGIPHGGWCPKGRKAEDGTIPPQYELQETSTANYLQRTEQNVIDSDGTLILSIKPELSGGSKSTAEFSHKHRKPLLHLHPTTPDAADTLKRFLDTNEIRTLNVAGPRASNEPQIAQFTNQTLDAAGRLLGLPIDINLVRTSLSLVALATQQVGAPKEPFPTPPWMTRRFSDRLIKCGTGAEVAALVESNIQDACAFVMFATSWLQLVEDGEAQSNDLPPDAAIEITAAGHAMIDFLDEMEEVYPEGLTEIPDEDDA